MLTCKYQNCEAEIKSIYYPGHSSNLTPVVRLTNSGSQKLILTTEYFPTREQAERNGIELARKYANEKLA